MIVIQVFEVAQVEKSGPRDVCSVELDDGIRDLAGLTHRAIENLHIFSQQLEIPHDLFRVFGTREHTNTMCIC